MEERNMNFRDSLTLNESQHNFNQSQGENVYDQYFMDFIEREIPKEPQINSIKIEILENWGASSEVGFNTIEFFNCEGEKIKVKWMDILTKKNISK